MKSTKLFVGALASACALALGIQSSQAQQYGAYVNLVRIYTNQDGTLVYRQVTNREFVRGCAIEQGITNLTGLSLVYDRTADALEVVRGTNATALCTPLTFSGGTWLSNSNLAKAERLAFVFVETNTEANGVLAATETFHYNKSNQLASFALSGGLQYTVPAHGTNPPAIYKGGLFAGSAFRRLADTPLPVPTNQQ